MNTNTETMSPADVLVFIDAMVFEAHRFRLDRGIETPEESASDMQARAAVAAMIERNAALEAQAPSALREKLTDCEAALARLRAPIRWSSWRMRASAAASRRRDSIHTRSPASAHGDRLRELGRRRCWRGRRFARRWPRISAENPTNGN